MLMRLLPGPCTYTLTTSGDIYSPVKTLPPWGSTGCLGALKGWRSRRWYRRWTAHDRWKRRSRGLNAKFSMQR